MLRFVAVAGTAATTAIPAERTAPQHWIFYSSRDHYGQTWKLTLLNERISCKGRHYTVHQIESCSNFMFFQVKAKRGTLTGF